MSLLPIRVIAAMAVSSNAWVSTTPNLRLALDRVQHWVDQGAQLSDTAARLVKEYSAKVASAA